MSRVERRSRAILRAMRRLKARLAPDREAALARRQQENFRRVAEREHGCARKVRYTRQASAERVRESRERLGSGPLHAYPCEFCQGWHLGKGERRAYAHTTPTKESHA